MRQFGITRGRPQIGENRRPPALPGILAPANSIFVPSEPPLERGKILQTLRDVFALIFVSFFLGAVAASLPLALFMLFFGSF